MSTTAEGPTVNEDTAPKVLNSLHRSEPNLLGQASASLEIDSRRLGQLRTAFLARARRGCLASAS